MLKKTREKTKAQMLLQSGTYDKLKLEVYSQGITIEQQKSSKSGDGEKTSPIIKWQIKSTHSIEKQLKVSIHEALVENHLNIVLQPIYA